MTQSGPLFWWDRPIPVEWQAALHRLAPPRERAPHLVLSWLSGDHRTPVQRWLLWQCTPRAIASDLVWSGFLAAVLERCGRDEETRWRTHYYLATGTIPEPLWLCQGPPQGHPFAYNEIDKKIASLLDAPSEAPKPGSMPYQPFYPDLALPALWRRSLFQRSHTDPIAEFEQRSASVDRAIRKRHIDRQNAILPDVVRHALPELLEGNVGGRRVDPDSPEGQLWVKGNADEADAAYIECGEVVTHAA